MKFANKYNAEKYIKDYILPEVKEFLREDSIFDVDKRSELSSLVKEIVRDGHVKILHETMIPFIEQYFYAKDAVLEWDYRMKRFLLEDIIEQDSLFGQWASGQDIIQAADEWSESLLHSSSGSWHYLWMLECMVRTGYEIDWKVLVQTACDKLLKEEVYGSYQRSEIYAMLYGAAMIYSHPVLNDEKKLEMLELLKNHWDFLKNIYSVMFRCVIGHRLTNMAQVANTVTLTKRNQPFLHLFYCALKANMEDFCNKKGDREKLEKQLQKIEDRMKSNMPSAELDELYGILFPEEFQFYLKNNRPKNYKQLESEYESFKRDMNERIGQMNIQISAMAEQLKTMAAASVPISVIADELMQLSAGVAWEVFIQLNGMLIENEAWVKHAGEIRKRIRQRMNDHQPTIQATNYYESGASHNDHQKHLHITNDKKQIG